MPAPRRTPVLVPTAPREKGSTQPLHSFEECTAVAAAIQELHQAYEKRGKDFPRLLAHLTNEVWLEGRGFCACVEIWGTARNKFARKGQDAEARAIDLVNKAWGDLEAVLTWRYAPEVGRLEEDGEGAHELPQVGMTYAKAAEKLLNLFGDSVSFGDVDAPEQEAPMPEPTPPEGKFPDDAKAEHTRTTYLQPGRAGKKLIGAYIEDDLVKELKEVLRVKGTTVQEFFAEAVLKALAVGRSPAQLEKLVDRVVAKQAIKYRARLLEQLKK